MLVDDKQKTGGQACFYVCISLTVNGEKTNHVIFLELEKMQHLLIYLTILSKILESNQEKKRTAF